MSCVAEQLRRALIGLIVSLISFASLQVDARVRTELGLEVRLDWRQALAVDSSQGVRAAELGALIQPSWSAAERRRWQVQLEPRIRGDLLASTGETEFVDVDLGQTFAEFTWERQLTLRAGSLRLGWGLTDVFNPLDLPTQKDLTDVLNINALGWMGVLVGWRFQSGWSIEMIGSPWTRATLLPGPKSRWLPRDLQRSQTVRIAGEAKPATVLLPEAVSYTMLDAEDVGSRPETGAIGLRLQRRSGHFEVQGVFYRGLAPVPAFELEVSGQIESVDPVIVRVDRAVALRPLRYQRQAAGLGVAWTSAPWIVRLAGAASQPIPADRRLGGWSHQGLLQVERTLNLGGWSLVALAGLSGQQSEFDADTTLASLERVFDRGGLFGLRVGWSERGSFLLGGVIDLARGGSLVRASLEQRIGEGFVSFLNIDLFDGDSTSPTGIFRRQDRVSLGGSLSY